MPDPIKKIEWLHAAKSSAPTALDADYFAIRETAENHVYDMQRAHIEYTKLIDAKKYQEAEKYYKAKVEGIKVRLKSYTHPKNITPNGFFLRAVEPKFWTRRIQKELTAAQIQMARVTGLIGLGYAEHDPSVRRSAYLPDYVIDRHIEQQHVTKDWLSTTIIKCGATTKTLAEVVEGAHVRRAAEIALFTRAQVHMNLQKGRVGFLLTITTPPSFHAMREVRNGKNRFSKPNPKYDGKTAHDALKWYRERWALFRARMQKLCGDGWEFSGSLEGHTDATPHWHVALYFNAELYDAVKKLLENVFVRNQNRTEIASNDELERGTLKHQIDLQPFKSANGAEAYAVKMALYAVKAAQEVASENPDRRKIAEANYAKKLGARTTFSSVQSKSMWRWLRTHREPDLLPEELRRAWHLAHGLSAENEELPRLKRDMQRLGAIDISERDFYEDGKGEAADVIEYLESIAVEYRPVFSYSDMYEYETKTADDYEQEQYIDPETGEVLSRISNEGYESMHNDWLAGDIYKNVKRRLNKYGEPLKPNPTKATSVARFDPEYIREDDKANEEHIEASGCWVIANNPFIKKWERDEEGSQILKAQKRQENQKKVREKLQGIKKAALQSRHTVRELQLLIPGQGRASHAEQPASIDAGADCFTGDVAGFRAHMHNLINNGAAASGTPPNHPNAEPK